jgi:hypothetical protein
MKSTHNKLTRRGFLIAATAGTAVTAAAIVAKQKHDANVKSGEASDSKQGYQLTEHVRNYYRTAQI